MQCGIVLCHGDLSYPVIENSQSWKMSWRKATASRDRLERSGKETNSWQVAAKSEIVDSTGHSPGFPRAGTLLWWSHCDDWANYLLPPLLRLSEDRSGLETGLTYIETGIPLA